MGELGQVYLVGAGPGNPDLLTVKAARLLGQAEVVVHDRLVSNGVLELAPATASMICVGKQPRLHPVPQEEINELLIQLGRSGRLVVRLKGGDPFIFGRGSEEALALARAGIPFEVVPGITAAQGCAASARVPLTHRGLARGVRYVTGHAQDDSPLDLDWASLADPQTTLVIYMGACRIRLIAQQLLAVGLAPETPVVAVANGTLPDERRIASTLGRIADAVQRENLASPLTFFIGRAAGVDLGASGAHPAWRLVQPAREAALA